MRMWLNDKGVASQDGSRKREMKVGVVSDPREQTATEFSYPPLTRHVGADGGGMDE